METKNCLACKKELKGRADKKFCDAQCRSVHHNKNKPIHELTIQKTNRSLRKNRTLLAHFCPSGKSTVRKVVLVELGYKFELFTHTFTFSKGTYYFCYDYGFLPIKDKGVEKALIVQKQNYMEHLNFNPWEKV